MQEGIRFAETDEELRASYQLRYQVYVESMGRFKDKSDPVLKELRDDEDKNARAIIAIKAGVPIGTLRLFWGKDAPFSKELIDAYHLAPFQALLDDSKICIVERLMVIDPHRGSSTTLHMYKEVMHFVLQHQIEAVLLVCEPHHLNSYLKLGFRPFTETYSYPGIGLAVPMVLIAGDYTHLKRVGSPFALLTKEQDLKYCRHTRALLKTIGHGGDIISQELSEQHDYLKKVYADNTLLQTTKPKLFDFLTEDEIQRLIAKSYIFDCARGSLIIDKDNSSRTLFIVLSGVVEVRRDGELQAIIMPGEVIGEIAFFLHIPRSASIVAATEEVRVLSLDEPSLSRLLKYESELANKVLMNLCRSLCNRVISGVETSDLRTA